MTQDLPEKRAVLQSPVRVLVIAPDTQAAEDRDNHLTDMKTLLGHPEPEFFQVVKSRRELLGLTASFPADVVYFLGAGQVQKGRVTLTLEGAEQLGLDDLRQALRGHFPQVLFLLGAPAAMDPIWLSAPRSLLPEIPVVVVGRGGPYQRFAPALAIRFLTQFLGDRQDPALALSQLESPLEIPESVARSAFLAYTAYDSFEVRPLLPQRKSPRSHLRLDRTLARAVVIEQVTRLVRSKPRRVEALIAHADVGNLLLHLAEQAVDHIERNGLAPVKRVQLDLPSERSDLHRSLEQQLLLLLGSDGIGNVACSGPASPSTPHAHEDRLRRGCCGSIGSCSVDRKDSRRSRSTRWRPGCTSVSTPWFALVHTMCGSFPIWRCMRRRRTRSDCAMTWNWSKQQLISDQFRAFLLPALPRESTTASWSSF